jgi:hypothetical protein
MDSMNLFIKPKNPSTREALFLVFLIFIAWKINYFNLKILIAILLSILTLKYFFTLFFLIKYNFINYIEKIDINKSCIVNVNKEELLYSSIILKYQNQYLNIYLLEITLSNKFKKYILIDKLNFNKLYNYLY